MSEAPLQQIFERQSLPPFEHSHYSGGGVLLYAYQQQKDGTKRAYLLLGQERELSYDDFGGSRGKGERHPILTAAREFYEESIGAIYNLEEITKKILESNIFVFEANFYQYWVEIPFDDRVLDNFSKVRKEKEPTATKYELEKQKLRWFAVENIRKSVQEFSKRRPDPYEDSKKVDPFRKPLFCEECVMRKHLIKTMSKAEQTGLLEKLEKGLLQPEQN
jgi:hypothetical protein